MLHPDRNARARRRAALRRAALATTALAVLGAGAPALAQTVAAAAVAPAQAQAQAQGSSSASDANQVAEVVVTAQKRAQRLLDVPVPVSAVNANTLVDQGVVRLADFYNQVPGLQYAGERVSSISLRGITTGGETNQTVAVMIDDVPFGGTTEASQPVFPDFDPATIDRVEVLRGPQGTLYGAASLGGLIQYVTKAPSLTTFSGRVEVGAEGVEGGTVGNSERGTINIPIWTDRIGLQVSAFNRVDPEWINDVYPTYTHKDVNARHVWGGRAALLFKITNDLKVTLSAIQDREYTNFTDISTSDDTPVCAACQSNTSTAPTNFTPLYGGTKNISLPGPNYAMSTYNIYSGRVDYNLHWAQLTSITAYDISQNSLYNDVTAAFGGFLLPAFGAPAGSTVAIANDDRTRKWSEELRLSSQGKLLDWLVGGFYTQENGSLNQSLFIHGASGSLLNTPYIGQGPDSYREEAAFGDVTWHVTDKLDLQVGGRYSQNKQTDVASVIIAPQAVMFFGPSSIVSAPQNGDAFTWLVSPSYHINSDLMAYARIATGYRPGGPNVGTPPNVQKTFSSDTVTDYDLGLKGYVIPHVLSIDVSLFDIEWNNIQLQDTDAVSRLTFLTNGGKARSQGVELSTEWRPWKAFVLDANAAYTDARLTSDLPVLAGATGLSGKSGDRLPYSAPFTFNLSPEQRFDLTDRIQGFVAGTYTYVGDRESAFQTASAAAPRPRYTLPSYSMVDLRTGVTFDRKYELSLFVRNVANEAAVLASSNRNGTAPPTAQFAQPRTIGVNLSAAF